MANILFYTFRLLIHVAEHNIVHTNQTTQFNGYSMKKNHLTTIFSTTILVQRPYFR